MKNNRYISSLFMFFLIIFTIGCNNEIAIIEGPLFQQISKTKSGIKFNNVFIETSDNNVYNNNIMYAGGGVAVGDLDNDGLQDIFFVSNEKEHALYLNKGDFRFDNIINKSNINATPGWATGVLMVDINQDGFLDIYINKGGHDSIPQANKVNELYINNGDLTFTEQAAAYGLNDKGSSTMTTFFDYDNDGDLDAYVLNYLTASEAPKNVAKVINSRLVPPDPLVSDHLYKQITPGKFVDVTAETNISNYGHGLGVAIADLNNDNKPDIYVTNDFEQSNYMFINRGGTFKENIKFHMGHVSYFAMGVDAADINNDGFVDIFEVDMAPKNRARSIKNMQLMQRSKFEELNSLAPQYMRNSLNINRGFGYKFSEVAQFSGVNKTDWSWATMILDLDDDGMKDIFVTNGILYDISDRDVRVKLDSLVGDSERKEVTRAEILEYSSSTPIQNYAYRNEGGYNFSNESTHWGFDYKGFSNGLAYGDFDNDGDLDLIINNLNSEPLLYKNTSRDRGANFVNVKFHGFKGNLNGVGAKVKIYTKNGIQFQEMYSARGFQSSSQQFVHFGLGDLNEIEKMEITWPNHKVQVLTNVIINKTVDVYQKDANQNFKGPDRKMKYFVGASAKTGIVSKHIESYYDDYAKEILIPHKLSQMGPFTAVGDVNGDQKDDLYVGGSASFTGELFVSNDTPLGYTKIEIVAFENDKQCEDIGALFFDSDGDGDLDLYVVSGSNQFKEKSRKYKDRLYLNDGKGQFTKSDVLPNETESGSCVVTSDFDKDGDMDLFIGGRILPSKYPYNSKSMILENKDGKFVNITNSIAKGLENIGMVTSAIWTDYDGDNDDDLIIVGEWMSIHVYQNTNGKFSDVSNSLGLENTSGWWNKISEWDFDKDGDMDYVVGNIGLNHKFKASTEKPFQVMCNDFDNTGNLDIVLAFEYDNKIVPVRGRDCSSEQMPFLADKFPNFEKFGKATVYDMFDKDKIDSSLNYKVQMFESIILENKEGKFSIRELPTVAQLSAINGILTYDLDKDGQEELLLVGNMFQTEAETSAADASVGVVFKYENDKFISLDMTDTGWFCPGDAKDLSVLKNDIPLFIITNNNNQTQVYGLK